MTSAYDEPVSSEQSPSGEKKVAEGSLSAAFMAHRVRLARFISLRCGGDDVEDLMHELWLKMRTVQTPIEKPLGYLYRMADRLVLDRRRGISRSRSRDGDWGAAHDRLIDTAEPPFAERRLLAQERLRGLNAALTTVGERAALIFRRYRLDGKSQRGIADELGVSVSTVEKDLRKIYDVLLANGERADEE